MPEQAGYVSTSCVNRRHWAVWLWRPGIDWASMTLCRFLSAVFLASGVVECANVASQIVEAYCCSLIAASLQGTLTAAPMVVSTAMEKLACGNLRLVAFLADFLHDYKPCEIETVDAAHNEECEGQCQSKPATSQSAT